MKTRLKTTVFFIPVLFLSLSFISCKKDTNGVNVDNIPEVPVMVENLYAMYGAPTVRTSLSEGGEIKIVLYIPENTGRTIKEITKISTGTAYQSLNTPARQYITEPISGNGNKVTFTTDLNEFRQKSGSAIPNQNQAGGTVAQAFLKMNFYFLLTLDNGDTIVPSYVRVFVDK